MAVTLEDDGMHVKQGTHRGHNLTAELSRLDPAVGNLSGELLYETLCLGATGGQPCAALGVLAATDMPDGPLQGTPYDGIVGLGLEGLSTNQLFGFPSRLFHEASGLKPQFAMYLGERGGEVAFGGYSQHRLASSLSWVPVARPEKGYWQVAIRAIRLGNRTLDTCKHRGCRGILDSFASDIRAPAKLTRELAEAISPVELFGQSACAGPDLQIETDGGTTLTITAKDYAGPACDLRVSASTAGPKFSDVIVLGQPFFQRYYTVFDVGERRLGFGLASNVDIPEEVSVTKQTQAEELEFGLDAENLETVDMLLLRGIAQYSSMVLFVLLIASRQKWSAKFQLARSSSWYEMSNIEVVPRDQVPAGDDCVICLGSCEEGCSGGPKDSDCWRRLPCNHQFHEDCIFEWFRKSKNCPVCRRPVSGVRPQTCGSAPL